MGEAHHFDRVCAIEYMKHYWVGVSGHWALPGDRSSEVNGGWRKKGPRLFPTGGLRRRYVRRSSGSHAVPCLMPGLEAVALPLVQPAATLIIRIIIGPLLSGTFSSLFVGVSAEHRHRHICQCSRILVSRNAKVNTFTRSIWDIRNFCCQPQWFERFAAGHVKHHAPQRLMSQANSRTMVFSCLQRFDQALARGAWATCGFSCHGH